MKIKAALVFLSMLAVSSCETTGDDVLTHTSYAMTAQDPAVVQSTLQSKLKVPAS